MNRSIDLLGPITPLVLLINGDDGPPSPQTRIPDVVPCRRLSLSGIPAWHLCQRHNCMAASAYIDSLLGWLCLTGHESNFVLGAGSQQLTHLGVVFDSVQMLFEITPWKAHCLQRVRKLVTDLLQQVVINRRVISACHVKAFCGLCFSLTFSIPWSRFYTLALYYSQLKGRLNAQGNVRLNHQMIRDLKFSEKYADRTCNSA